jgi:hypothetical protein
MKIPAALISVGVGAVFFTVASVFYYQPSFIGDYALEAILNTNHSRARAAVSRLLFNPASAQFDVLRSVQVDAAKYVCGHVNAKDKSGAYAGYKAFVYTVAIDFARIDDDGQIAQKHDAFKTCPLSEEEEKLEQQKLAISPGALSTLKTIQKVIPTADPSTLSTMASQLPSPAGKSPPATTEQQLGQLGQLAGQPGSAGQQQSNLTFKAALDSEGDWRGDRPPAAWPVFPREHPLSKPVKKRTTVQAITLAAGVEERWAQFKAGNSTARPSPDDIREALRGLLAIDPKDEGFPQAWAAFVRLRKIERDLGA